jgi:hypothetical protein
VTLPPASQIVFPQTRNAKGEPYGMRRVHAFSHHGLELHMIRHGSPIDAPALSELVEGAMANPVLVS